MSSQQNHAITVKGPVALNMDNCVTMQKHLEGVFGKIIHINMELSKRPPRVAARDLQGLENDVEGLVQMMEVISKTADRWPDVEKRMRDELQIENDGLTTLRQSLSASSRTSTVEYDLCQTVLTTLKTVLEHMVTLLEHADDVPVLDIQARARRCKEQLVDIRKTDKDSLPSFSHAIDVNHDNIARSVKNRLVVIEAAEPHRRLKAAWDDCAANFPQLKTDGFNATLADKMDKIYDELIAAGAYKPPIVFEVDSDHIRKKVLAMQKPYRDQLDDSSEKLTLAFAELDELLNGNGSAEDIAKVTKGIVGEVKNEAELARAMAAEAEDKGRAANYRNTAGKLDKHAPELAGACKKFCKAKQGNQSLSDPEAAVRAEMDALKAANDRLKALLDPNRQPPPSLLSAVASALEGLDQLVKAAQQSQS